MCVEFGRLSAGHVSCRRRRRPGRVYAVKQWSRHGLYIRLANTTETTVTRRHLICILRHDTTRTQPVKYASRRERNIVVVVIPRARLPRESRPYALPIEISHDYYTDLSFRRFRREKTSF